jgi:16S rRNA processing protein RimM
VPDGNGVVPTDTKLKTEEPVLLGRVSGLYGVKGWVRVFSYTEPRQAILSYKDCLLQQEGNWSPVRLAEGRQHGKTVVVRMDGVVDRDAAATLIGADIGILRQHLPETAAAQYYWADLEGLEVRHRGGHLLGKVAYLLATGANDVLVVHGGENGGQEVLIPFLPGSVILDVDLAAGVIDVDWEWD